ncbi:phosphatidylinositol 3,4,5-trisphosphate 3-phosphatase and protein-tyrosine-phosphatase PTEN2A-like [Heracleum sosnowskyi]|uniref:Phosphatidylinositol 3,4,5-trisphosphate 3-phosphatase and protein-tyrosine-phosphatase PTEN2A-like n=1 Tax=Heracleum sosnowskyi TaxID=360622 RepID=A0AAD8NAZ2_9APIA|nr:phosphatidylinositol 3,4,5-trisphosphate 3-phosphatase and protein-tyrosine-phosphatase PTEN2A-like [Heracleum sosnowskyi]
MESASNENETSATHLSKAPEVPTQSAVEADNATGIEPSKLSTSGLSTWAKSLKIPDLGGKQDSTTSDKSPFARFTSGLGLRLSPKAPQTNDNSEGTSPSAQSNFIGTLTKGLVDSSKSAVKAVQVKARHVVSQNKRRYQEGGFDLDMTYITENIIAMGFPAGDMSSGFFGYVEGFYRNHMEEVIKFFETHHKDKYKVYNLCSERLYDASLFEGKVASFPFDDHNCPPIQLIISFCKSAYSWLKEDIENVVVVHCKAGMARTGLMISSLLLYLKFFPTAEESIDYYNQKRCFDSKGLVLPSQIRYVKYFERILTYFNGENQPGRRCMLRGFRLHRCPYWIRPSITISNHNGVLFSTKKHPRTKDLSPEDYWFSAPKKGVMVFALPGEPGLTELAGDFKIHFHDGQGDFYCWLNTTMIENRKVLTTNELDGFDKRKLPSPGFQLEVVLVDYNGAPPNVPVGTTTETSANGLVGRPGTDHASTDGAVGATAAPQLAKESGNSEKDDDVFSDNEAEEANSSKPRQARVASEAATTDLNIKSDSHGLAKSDQVSSLSNDTEKLSLGKTDTIESKKAADGAVSGLGTPTSVGEVSEFKAMAADASVFTFGDEDDYGSD